MSDLAIGTIIVSVALGYLYGIPAGALFIGTVMMVCGIFSLIHRHVINGGGE